MKVGIGRGNMASLVHDRFVAALARGLGETDWSAIARIVYQDAGLKEKSG